MYVVGCGDGEEIGSEDGDGLGCVVVGVLGLEVVVT